MNGAHDHRSLETGRTDRVSLSPPSGEDRVSLAAALDNVVGFINRYVVLTAQQTDAIALWVAHTWCVNAADTTPYIAVTSAEKRSGKTRLLEVLELVVHAPLPTANISDAALFRAIGELDPTLLLDEIDAIFGPKARDREDLRGMLNAGYRRGTVTRRMGGPRMTTLEEFPVFCPKVFAGIGDLPDTLADRSIRIRLERRTRDEPVERFRRRDVAAIAAPVSASLEKLLARFEEALTDARPHLPDELDDRAQDYWEPLLAIADFAGEEWPTRARIAAVTLSSGGAREDQSLGSRLLADLDSIFKESGVESYKTADLIAELAKIEENPWGDWYGKPISMQALGKLLKPYRIKTMSVWVNGGKHRGYKREQFEDAWLRVLGGRSGREGSPGSSIEAPPTAPTAPTALVTVDALTPELPPDAPQWERDFWNRKAAAYAVSASIKDVSKADDWRRPKPR